MCHCPSINLDIDKIPKVDILNISHRHQDHFDIRTLAFSGGQEHDTQTGCGGVGA